MLGEGSVGRLVRNAPTLGGRLAEALGALGTCHRACMAAASPVACLALRVRLGPCTGGTLILEFWVKGSGPGLGCQCGGEGRIVMWHVRSEMGLPLCRVPCLLL